MSSCSGWRHGACPARSAYRTTRRSARPAACEPARGRVTVARVTERKVTGVTTVHAPAERIFALLVDPAKHPLIDGSGTVTAVREGSAPERLELGSRFGMEMRLGLPYRVTNRVVEFEQDRLIAWRHLGGHRWRWELRPIDERTTEVTETFDYST